MRVGLEEGGVDVLLSLAMTRSTRSGTDSSFPPSRFGTSKPGSSCTSVSIWITR